MIKILNILVFLVKNAIFSLTFFGENIWKIITSVPGHPAADQVNKVYIFYNFRKKIGVNAFKQEQLIFMT
jgi:hypothetical protein